MILTSSSQNNQATAAQRSSLLGLYQQEWHKNNHPEIFTAHYKGFHKLDHGIPPDRGRELIPLLQNQMMGGEANG